MSLTGTGITIDYKGLVLEMVDGGLHGIPRANRTMLELRLTLFVAAATSAETETEECLVPFPPCFFDPAAKLKNVWLLQDYIQLIPPLDNLNSETELPPIAWELLYWIFTNPLTITPLFETTNMAFLSEAEMTKLYDTVKAKTNLELPLPKMRSWCMGMSFSASSREYFIFEVETPNPKTEFVEGKKKYGSYFAFHGSSLHNFHSIIHPIHRGLCSTLNKRSLHGVGNYFSSRLSTAKTYSLSLSGPSPSWKKSVFGMDLRCVAICEIVNAPEGIVKPTAALSVVADDNLIQLTYLIMFAPAYTAWNNARKEMETTSGD